MSELRECRWCGHHGVGVKGVGVYAGPEFQVYCFMCGAGGPVRLTEAKAIEAWNTRPATTTEGELREAVEKAVDWWKALERRRGYTVKEPVMQALEAALRAKPAHAEGE